MISGICIQTRKLRKGLAFKFDMYGREGKGKASWKSILQEAAFLQLSHPPACPEGGWGKGKNNQLL